MRKGKLRVAFCLNGPDAVNGPNVWLTRQLPLLAQLGVEPVVLYLSWMSDRSCFYRADLKSKGIAVIPVSLGRFVEENARIIAETADELELDAFVPNYSIAGYYAARFLRAAGVATVGTLHSDDPYYHDIVDVFVTGSAHWRLSGVVGVSDYLKTLMRERAGDAMPYLHAPYGSPVPDQKACWSARRFRMIYSGRLVERQKRIRRVVGSMLEAAHNSNRVEGVLYGDGEERYWIDATVAQSAGRVRLGGLLTPHEMQKAMLDGQAFVLLSDFEGLSIALMEAMACGLVPIVAEMRSGVTDLVKDGVTGLVVPAEDSTAFAEAVIRLARDKNLWDRLSKAARSAVIEGGYTSDQCAAKWCAFLEELVSRSSPKLPLCIPPIDEWAMPERSNRPHGMKIEDRRVAWPRMKAVAMEGRPIYLWGASRAGMAFLDSVPEGNVRIDGFVDSDPEKWGHSLRERLILSPDEFSRLVAGSVRPFLVITSQYEAEISTILYAMGMAEVEDFVAG